MDDLFSRETAEAYDSFYKTEAGRRIDDLEKSALAGFLADIPRERILELGCGTGHWTEFFCGLGFPVIAVDASESMLAQARKKNIRGAEFLHMSAERLSFSGSSFSIVASVTMFEFLADQDAGFSEAGRVLKPGGYFIGGFLNAESMLGRPKKSDSVVSRGRLFTMDGLAARFSVIGEAEFRTCVRFSEDMEPKDGTPEAERWAPAFIAAKVRKNR